MKTIGLDIGTTTISAVVAENGKVIESITKDNCSFITTFISYEHIQSPEIIKKIAIGVVDELIEKYPDIEKIGVTGQMHGILYLDLFGNPVSPLYTWQDGRGNQAYQNGITYAEFMRNVTGYKCATGFGLVTHFYNMVNNLVPNVAAVFSTIHSYIAMVLANNKEPLVDPSDAASFGFFNVEHKNFDLEAIEKLGINQQILPTVTKVKTLGKYRNKLVYPAIGDNQASFIGATSSNLDSFLVNVGTGSQISIYSKDYKVCEGLETRPFPNNGYLLVGAPLCGGKSYALLERFFHSAASMLGLNKDNVYKEMADLLESSPIPSNLPIFTPLFQGTRDNPDLKASIKDLSVDNFTPLHMIYSLMNGMSNELHELFLLYVKDNQKPSHFIGSGNGLRRNRFLQECFRRMFKQELQMSHSQEEAALGVAILVAESN